MARRISGKGRRQKGAQGEREFFSLLNKFLPARLHMQRELSQTRDGGSDGQCEFCAIEVKRQERLNLPGWLKQAREQAKETQVPVVAYRQSREQWTVLVDMDMVQFAAWLRYRNNLMHTEENLRYQLSYGAGNKLPLKSMKLENRNG